ncbi:hypothetical protein CEXT_574101 [Caerostris extrusa]|uniref:Uncharacterized protein n=1 Tax=Caerostris extrusa TaxID=172846 RepID=A0AAV4VZE1_CAEEX|nr:hypothetical protein CEXT_574101 [Caerostris extrusa]
MATGIDENLLGQQSTVPTFMWIVLAFVLITIWGCCIAVCLKWRAWKRSSSTDQLSQLQISESSLPTAPTFGTLRDGERHCHPDSFMQQYQCFDFPAYGNFEAPPKYSDAVHQESSVGRNGRFNCPVIAQVENMSAFQPAYQNLLNNA